MKCIDLRPTCKDRRWKWYYEESFRAEHMSGRNSDAPWYVIVPCRNGALYSIGGDELAANVENHPNVAAILGRLPGLNAYQGKVAYRFPVSMLDTVAEIMRPKRIGGRVPTHEDLERLARHAFPSTQTEPESPETVEPIPTPSPRVSGENSAPDEVQR